LNEAVNSHVSQRIVITSKDRQWAGEPGRTVCMLESRPDGNESFFVSLNRGESWRFASSGDVEVFVISGTVHSGTTLFPPASYFWVSQKMAPFILNAVDGDVLLFIKIRHPEGMIPDSGMVQTGSANWIPGLVSGLNVMPLFSSGVENTALVRWDPGTVFQPHRHIGGEEVLVLSGVFEDEFGSYPEGTWYRSPHLSRHHPFSVSGCTIFVKTGHLML